MADDDDAPGKLWCPLTLHARGMREFRDFRVFEKLRDDSRAWHANCKGRRMKPVHILLCAIFVLGGLSGCSTTPTKSPDVTGPVRQSLDGAGLKDVSVSQDRDKGVVTLKGHVASDAEKAQAESIASSQAAGQVVANEIAVIPQGAATQAKNINSDVDKGIRDNLDAALIQNGLNKSVKYDVKNGVITLTGQVNSEELRSQVAQIAAGVPYQQQVVNELQVKDQKATSN